MAKVEEVKVNRVKLIEALKTRLTTIDKEINQFEADKKKAEKQEEDAVMAFAAKLGKAKNVGEVKAYREIEGNRSSLTFPFKEDRYSGNSQSRGYLYFKNKESKTNISQAIFELELLSQDEVPVKLSDKYLGLASGRY